MQSPPKKICMIAGELSGDRLGARLMQSLHKMYPDAVEFIGIGGPWMQAQGFTSLFPMHELSLMGFVEVVPHIFRLKRRIRETVAMIEAQRPDMVLTIDSPGFTFRVVRMLRERGVVAPKFVHYVAPTVWAYKPERAAKTAALFDALLVLLPFEPPYFTAHGLATYFVGHPVVDAPPVGVEYAQSWRDAQGFSDDTRIITLFLGSRKGEVTQHLPVFKQVVAQLHSYDASLVFVLPVPPHLEAHIRDAVADWGVAVRIVTREEDKWAATASAYVALVKSGTVALEVAMCGTPMVTAYKVHPLTAWMVRKMLRTPFVNLVNVLSNRMVIEELLQEACCAEKIVPALTLLLDDEAARQQQISAMHAALQMLHASPDKTASDNAAEVVYRLL
jgi:lipid-A-disaccharide synthase